MSVWWGGEGTLGESLDAQCSVLCSNRSSSLHPLVTGPPSSSALPFPFLHSCSLTAKLAGKKSPDTYVAFQKLLSTLPPPTEPKPVPASLPSRELCSISEEQYRVPSLTDMGFDAAEATTPFKGGETLALERMRLHLQRKQWVAAFEKPNTAPNSLEPSTTVLSPYLKFGCLSCRSFYWGLKAVEKEFKSCSQPPVSLMGQLLWREFFYYQSYITPNFDRMIGNPRCKQISWDYNEAYIQRWRDAQTGFPWIDAAMTQLRREGWMHHLSRHAVACFLTRGDLYQSWEHGAKVFDQLLLDSDWALNNGEWAGMGVCWRQGLLSCCACTVRCD